eukprot:1386463-Amorphochlora_amoeboformis.AAC.1
MANERDCGRTWETTRVLMAEIKRQERKTKQAEVDRKKEIKRRKGKEHIVAHHNTSAPCVCVWHSIYAKVWYAMFRHSRQRDPNLEKSLVCVTCKRNSQTRWTNTS